MTTRQRMISALASFTTLRLESQVKKFGQSALNIGMTREEVVEVVMQTAPYSGFPPALNALVALNEVLLRSSGHLQCDRAFPATYRYSESLAE